MQGFRNGFNEDTKCSHCRSTDIVTDRRAGEVICRSCGVVLGERLIDDGAEWRTYNNDDTLYGSQSDPNRAGAATSPLLSAEAGLNTMIEGGRDKQATAKLQKVQGIAMKESASEVALKECYTRAREIAHNLGLPPSVQEDACMLLRQVENAGCFKAKRGVHGDAMCAAVIYLTCRQQGVSRTLLEVAPAASVTRKEVVKKYKHLEKKMKIERGTVRGEHLVPRFSGVLGVRSIVTVAATHVAQKASELDLVGGMQPPAVAAAALLLACSCCSPGAWRDTDGNGDETDGSLSVSTIAKECGVSRNTLCKPYLAMFENRQTLISDDFLRCVKAKNGALANLPSLV